MFLPKGCKTSGIQKSELASSSFSKCYNGIKGFGSVHLEDWPLLINFLLELWWNCPALTRRPSLPCPPTFSQQLFSLSSSLLPPLDLCRDSLLWGGGVRTLSSLPSSETLPLCLPLPSAWALQGQFIALCVPGEYPLANCLPQGASFQILSPGMWRSVWFRKPLP